MKRIVIYTCIYFMGLLLIANIHAISPCTSSIVTTMELDPEKLYVVNGDTGQNTTYTVDQLNNSANVYIGQGGYKCETTGTISGPYSYRAVPILSLLEAIGGISGGDKLIAVATDEYEVEFSYEEIYGAVPAYDSSGNSIPTVDVTMSVLFEKIGEEGFDEGPFRIGFLNETEGYITSANCWPKYIQCVYINQVIDLTGEETNTTTPTNPSSTGPTSELSLAITTAVISISFLAIASIKRKRE